MGVGRGQRLSLPAFPGGVDGTGQGYGPVRTQALGSTRFRIEPKGPRPVYLPGKPEATVLKNRYCHGKLKGRATAKSWKERPKEHILPNK